MTDAEEYQTKLTRDEAEAFVNTNLGPAATALGRSSVTPSQVAELPINGLAYVLAACLMWQVEDRPQERFLMQEFRDDEDSAAVVLSRAITGIRVLWVDQDDDENGDDDDDGDSAALPQHFVLIPLPGPIQE